MMNVIIPANFNSSFARHMDNTMRSVFTENLQRQVIGSLNAWCTKDCPRNNIMYVYYNIENDGKIYGINKNSVFYDD